MQIIAVVVGAWIVGSFGVVALWVGFVYGADWYLRRQTVRAFRRQLAQLP